jgi:hypothetical protein
MEFEGPGAEILREQQLYREVVAILIGTDFYFDLNLDERYRLVKDILVHTCLSMSWSKSMHSLWREISN